jgi:fructuronate reductase
MSLPLATRTLTQELLEDTAFWQGKNVLLPRYDRRRLPIKSISFSAGRMAYGHTGDILQDLLADDPETGLMIGVETYAARPVAELAATDYLMTQLIFENERGVVTPKIQGAMQSVLFVDDNMQSLTWQRLMELARDPRIQFATINAPEGAYGMAYTGRLLAEPISEAVKRDLAEGTVTSDAGKWTAFARERFAAGLPFAVVSCTNFSSNGHVTGAAFRTMAKAWEAKGFAPTGLVDYLSDPRRFAFPNCMIVRTAVAPDEKALAVIERLGIRSNLVVTERTRYWVVEDCFPSGRPAFERADGVIVEESYAEVKKYEDMKIRIMNMGNSTIGGLGVLLGNRGKYGVYRAMQDPDLPELMRRIMDIAIQTMIHPKQMDPRAFARDSFVRLSNPNIPDDPMRAALNGSTKMLPRFLDTYFAGLEKGMDPARLDLVLLPVAGFLRYTMGVDDRGEAYALEDDPIKGVLVSCGGKARLGDPRSASAFAELIARKDLMGKDLFVYGNIGKRLQDMVGRMLAGPGSVRKALQTCLQR